MAIARWNSDGTEEGTPWPMPKFRFEVDLGTGLENVAFQEVSGMDQEVQTITYRHSNSALFSTIKMPGIAKYGNITMKRGVFSNDNEFWQWVDAISMNTIQRRTITIRLLNDNDQATVTWTLNNAWPTKISGQDLTDGGNDIAVDTVELAHEQMIVTAGPGSESITGTNQPDVLHAGASTQRLAGAGGNDTLVAGAQAEQLSGGDGADRFEGTADSLNGDTVTDLDRSDQVLIHGTDLSHLDGEAIKESIDLGRGRQLNIQPADNTPLRWRVSNRTEGERQVSLLQADHLTGIGTAATLQLESATSLAVLNPSNLNQHATNLRVVLNSRSQVTTSIGAVITPAGEAPPSDPTSFKTRAHLLFSSLPDRDVTDSNLPNFEQTIQLDNGESISFFLTQESSIELLSDEQIEALQWFTLDLESNGDVSARSSTGLTLQIEPDSSPPSLAALLATDQPNHLILDTTQVETEQRVNGRLHLAREADFDPVIGFYQLADSSGAVLSPQGGLIRPGESGYAAAALEESNRVDSLSLSSVDDDQRMEQSISLQGGLLLAPYAISQGMRFFPYSEANLDGITHFRLLGENSFGFEDQLGGGDGDFDDLIITLDSLSLSSTPTP